MTTKDSNSAPTPFATRTDGCYLWGDLDDGRPPALQVNPEASVSTLLAAAQRRADMLHKMLRAWSVTGEGEATAVELAEALEPAADEIHSLIVAASAVAHRSEKESANA